ncbi:hypothetical protein [Polaribacter sp. IC073]|uniref:hypothetical protein n=1 Tax=Polaribacter sp. IC073 TaxID=2508540 RepID=UPI00167AB3CC|nr:hypothetical protein [Polaribacter sp. IC073]
MNPLDKHIISGIASLSEEGRNAVRNIIGVKEVKIHKKETQRDRINAIKLDMIAKGLVS